MLLTRLKYVETVTELDDLKQQHATEIARMKASLKTDDLESAKIF